ncbi:methyltransferase, TIGR04325 family [Bradyrhizobium sp. LjRoot220]|uniref:methyltransferase, TIGR04325 family n=1 Tax=Bradyrhizobium sp. LjRoot220 TaxID=3342284 RepID=UPI003ECF0EB7
MPEAITWTGDYESFDAALAACTGDSGYHGSIATDRYVRRYEEVRANPAQYYTSNNQHLIRYMAALSSAAPVDGRIRVLDFGGGYGSLYEIIRGLLPQHDFDWTIVEVPELVARGNEMGASDRKRFAVEIPRQRYSLVIASGVLQCVRDPEGKLSELLSLDCKSFLIGRVPICPFIERDRITVQSVPPSMFAAKFPSWIFSPRWRELLIRSGERVMVWESPGDTPVLDGVQFQADAFLIQR